MDRSEFENHLYGIVKSEQPNLTWFDFRLIISVLESEYDFDDIVDECNKLGITVDLLKHASVAANNPSMN